MMTLQVKMHFFNLKKNWTLIHTEKYNIWVKEMQNSDLICEYT